MNNKERSSLFLCPLCKKDIPFVSFAIIKENVVLHLRCPALNSEMELSLNEYKAYLNENDCDVKEGDNSFGLVLNCVKHEEKFNSFCIQCHCSLCAFCIINHNAHQMIPLKSAHLTMQSKGDENQIKAFLLHIEDLQKQFNLQSKEGTNQLLIKHIRNQFITHLRLNQDLFFLWKLIANTAFHVKDNPNYPLMTLVNKLQLSQAKPIEFSHDYDQLQRFLKENYLIDVRLTQIKEYSNVKSHRWSCHSKLIRSVIQLSNNWLCSASEDATVKVWELNTFKCLQVLEGHTHTVTCLLQLEDGRLVSGSFDHSIKLWYVSQAKCLHTIQGEHGSIWCLNQLHNNDLASGSYYSYIEIRDIHIYALKASIECTNTIWELKQLSNGMLFACFEIFVGVYNPSTGEKVSQIKAHEERIMSLIELKEKKQFASSSIDKKIRIWDMKSLQCLQTLSGHNDGIYSIVQLNTWLLASCSWDKQIKIWEITTSQCIATFLGDESVIGLLKLHDGRLASYAGSMISLWIH